MAYRDISAEIEAISRGYVSHPLPHWVLRAQEILQQWWQSVQEWLNHLFQHKAIGPANNTQFSTLLQYALYLAGALAFIAICVLLARKASLRRQQLASKRRGAASIDKILDSQGYRKDAERLAATGDFKGACRALYLSLLQQMHEKKVAIFAPAKTNYEYRYLLISFPKLQSNFIEIADIVEQIWFGNKQAAREDFSQCRRLLATAEKEVESVAAARAKLNAEAEL